MIGNDSASSSIVEMAEVSRSALNRQGTWTRSSRDWLLIFVVLLASASRGLPRIRRRRGPRAPSRMISGAMLLLTLSTGACTTASDSSRFTNDTRALARVVAIEVGSGASAARVTTASHGRLAVRSIQARSASTTPSASRVATEAGSIRNVNPLGGTNNCVNCSVATDATLSGAPSSALNVRSGVAGQPISVLEDIYGGAFKPVSGQAQIEQMLMDGGSGSRGIVFGSRGADAPGHVFNAVNQNGAIRFLDGQTGGVASFKGYTGFEFLVTG